MKRIFILLLCIFSLFFSFYGIFITQAPQKNLATSVKTQPPLPTQRLLLLPLDSRSQTMNFPVDLGKLANIEVQLPPRKLMDLNTQPAKKEELIAWLEDNVDKADGIILSTDSLLHGGLVASRRINPEQLTPQYADHWNSKLDSFILRLWQIKKKNPKLKIYGFSIIPRQLVSSEPPASHYQPHLYYYSQYKDRVAHFENQKDIEKLSDWASILPAEILQQYHLLFERNFATNKRLIDETEKGLFTLLIIGQDDAQPFGIPNWYREKTEAYTQNKAPANNKVFFTGGTDEIAQLLVARHQMDTTNFQFKIFPYFTETEASHRIFPYMRETLEVNMFEKFKLLGVQKADSPEKADLILVIHGGFPNSDQIQIQKSADLVNKWLQKNKKVAIIDLSRNFSKEETFLPNLIKVKAPLLQLTSYAGWNTASNSFGTALSQGILFSLGEDFPFTSDTFPARHNEQVKFLIARLLDDWAFQKSIQSYENNWLKLVGTNPYDLGYQSEKISKRTTQEIQNNFSLLYRESFVNTPYQIAGQSFKLKDIEFTQKFPWKRTFEIELPLQLLWIKN